jgi:hypothetical protein
MPEFNFDPSTALDAYRSVFAPTLRAQQEALKTIERRAPRRPTGQYVLTVRPSWSMDSSETSKPHSICSCLKVCSAWAFSRTFPS